MLLRSRVLYEAMAKPVFSRVTSFVCCFKDREVLRANEDGKYTVSLSWSCA